MDIIIKQRYWVASIVCIILYMGYCVWDPSLSFLYESGVGKKAIVVGATSGMGRETAKLLMADGYTVGCVGRRQARLDELKTAFGERCVTRSVDVSNDKAIGKLQELIKDMGGCDLMMISVSGTAEVYRQPDRYVDRVAKDRSIIDVDIAGFWRAAVVAREHFEQQQRGHLVGVSSTSGLIGEPSCPLYAGSNALIQRYLTGIRNHAVQNGMAISVTDIVPGYVDVEYCEPGLWAGEYWNVPSSVAGKQIFNAIKAGKKVAYITKRWRLVAWLYRLCPDWLYNLIGGF